MSSLVFSSAASRIEFFGAFARLPFCISALPLLRCYMGCSAVAVVAVRLLYKGYDEKASSRL